MVRIDRLSAEQRDLLERYLRGASIPFELSTTTVSVAAAYADDLYSVLKIVGNARSKGQTLVDADDDSTVAWQRAVLPGGARIASPTRRMIAAAIDWVLVSAATIAADPRDVWLVVVGMALYTVLATAVFGQTIGKLVVGIKVVAEHTLAPPGYARALLRWGVTSWGEIVGLALGDVPIGVEAVIFTILVLTYAPILWDRRGRGWHDRIAGTVVIKAEDFVKTRIGSADTTS